MLTARMRRRAAALMAAVLTPWPAACASAPTDVDLRVESRREVARQRAEIVHARSHATLTLGSVERVLPDVRVGEALRRDVQQDAQRLQEGLDRSDDAAALRARAAVLNARVALVASTLTHDDLVASFESDIGRSLSPELKREVAASRAAAQRALRGGDWDDLTRASASLTRLHEDKLHELSACWQTTRAVHKLAARISAELRRQADEAWWPVAAAAARATDWDEVLVACRALPPASHQPRQLLEALEQGLQALQRLESSERSRVQAAIDDVERALRGTSWPQALAAAQRIRPAAVASFGHELAMQPAPCLRILSIDGGGVRGVIPATMLVEIERRTGKPISTLFDYVVGTSAGGILALGLTVPDPDNPRVPRYTAAALARSFEDDAAAIFPKMPLLSTVRQVAAAKYSPSGIERVLERYFGNALLADALTNVFVTSYALEERLHVTLGNLDDGAALLMREAARATSAAPTYFPPVRISIPRRPLKTGGAPSLDKPPQGIDHITMVDGGVFANNPTPFALSRLIDLEHTARFYSPRTRPWLVVSLGTGQLPPSTSDGDLRLWGLVNWAVPLVNIMFSNPGVDAARLLQPSDPYFRFQPQTLVKANASLDDASRSNIEALKHVAQRYLETHDADLQRLTALLSRTRPAGCARTLGQP